MQKYSVCFTTLVMTYLPHGPRPPCLLVLRDNVLAGDSVNHLGTVLPAVKLASVSAVTSP